MVRSPTRARTCAACCGVRAPDVVAPASAEDPDDALLQLEHARLVVASARASAPAVWIRRMRRMSPDYYETATYATAW
jgi:hypothetical protein